MDTMDDFELYPDEEEEAAEDEVSNRRFIIIVAALGIPILIAVCAIILFVFVLGPQMRQDIASQNATTQVTNTAVALAGAQTATANAQPTATEVPTDTPEPTDTATPIPTETPTPTPTPAEVAEANGEEPDGENGENGENGVTGEEDGTETPAPTATVRATEPANGAKTPETGLGIFGIGAVALGLLLVLAMVRRLRQMA